MKASSYYYMAMLSLTLFIGENVHAPTVRAQNDSVRATFEKYGLLGTFAPDCSKPPNKENVYFVNRALGSDRVQRDQMSSATMRDSVTIIDKATLLGPNEIGLSGTHGGLPTELVWRVEGNRQRGIEATIGGNRQFSAGRWVGNGLETEWLTRCEGRAASGKEFQTGSVQAILEKYNLVGIFAADCGKQPSVDNIYYIFRVHDPNHAQRDVMDGPSSRPRYIMIDKVAAADPNRLSENGLLTGILGRINHDRTPSEAVWHVEANRIRFLEASLGTQKIVTGGKFITNSQDTPWYNRCRN
jgi:hypothetical protein